jgi:hypothetical protein
MFDRNAWWRGSAAATTLLWVGVGCGGSSKTDHSGGGSSGASAESGGSGGAGKGGTGGKGGGSSGRGGAGGSGASGGSVGTGGSGGGPLGGAAGEGTAGSGATAMAGTGGGVYVTELRQTSIDKVDILFMIDNSSSMAAKQSLLAASIPVLAQRLIEPECVDADGNSTGVSALADGTCSAGVPEFPPIRDMHVGIITSSLGDHGSNDVCSDAQNAQTVANGGVASQYNDLAELLPAVRTNLTSWNDSGFLVWDPRDQATVSDPHANLTDNETDAALFSANLEAQATAPGETGCGYESSLEAWYRFLIDPSPVSSLTNNGTTSVRGMTNQVVLAERAAFLRPDSLLTIVMMSDENDCSITDENGSQGWVVGYKGGVGLDTFRMPRASAVCADNANDPCCHPCTSAAPSGCADNATDPACSMGTSLSVNEDSLNLRCFEQAGRFGVDLLYPTSRYVEAISQPFVTPRLDGVQVPNPLYAAGPGGAPPRSSGNVFLAGIIGVPWQDLSSEDSWNGPGLTYLSASDLVANGRWDVMLGDPLHNVLPTDPLMIEAIDPRPTGAPHPLLPSVTIAAASSTTNTNPINGHEQQVLPSRDDLQFACIFPLPQPVVCDSDNSVTCDCNADEYDRNSPLCTGVTATTDGTQVYGKAYPGVRELEVLKGVGESAVVASICAKNTTTDLSPAADPNHGYNPAVSAIVSQMSESFTPKCLPRALAVSPGSTSIPCTILEASTPTDGNCDCAARNRGDAPAVAAAVVRTNMKNDGLCDGALPVACADVCLCELPQLTGEALDACQAGDADEGTAIGFCYIDPAAGAGSDVAVRECPASSKRLIRFEGENVPAKDSTAFIACGVE